MNCDKREIEEIRLAVEAARLDLEQWQDKPCADLSAMERFKRLNHDYRDYRPDTADNSLCKTI